MPTRQQVCCLCAWIKESSIFFVVNMGLVPELELHLC